MRLALCWAALFVLGANGCRQPAPPPVEHQTSGTIEGGRYHAPDGSFHCVPPHAVDTAEFVGSVLRDGRDADENGSVTYVTFGPGPTDPAGYHVVLAHAPANRPDVRPLQERATQIVSHYMASYDREFGGSAERVVFDPVIIGGRTAIYAVYRYDYRRDGSPSMFYTAFAIIRFSASSVVNVMAEWLTLENPWYPGIDTLSARQWQRFNELAASVEVSD
jgi:hypothetical protein